jgi:hypothetical protein
MRLHAGASMDAGQGGGFRHGFVLLIEA